MHLNQSDWPFVSVIIPCFNEQRFIGGCLESIVANDYPKNRLEVLVIDGMSTDGTRDIVASLARQYPFVKLVDNPDKIKPIALNLGIRQAQGGVIIRMDAHAVYEADYVLKSVQYLREYQADNVGGIRKTLPSGDSALAKAIAYSVSHPFAAGNATYRTGAKTVKWVDTVFGGCYPRHVFERIGLFNEDLVRGQDREFNTRLIQAGGKILLAPDIVCYYFARSHLRDFLSWTFANGLTPFYISKIVGRMIFSWRNLIPVAFVLGLVFLPLLACVLPAAWGLLFAVIGVYLALGLYFSIPIAWQERDFRFVVLMLFIFASTHLVYGLGSLLGIFKSVERHAEWSKV